MISASASLPRPLRAYQCRRSPIRARASMQPEEYLKLAAIEDGMWYFRSLHAHMRRELDAAKLPPDAQILDVGCGTGGLILRLRPTAPSRRWTGLDYSPLACDLARQRCGNDVQIHQASATSMPFADASFDAIVTADVLCQLDDSAPAVAEFARVLRPGGLLVLNVPAYMWMWSYHDDAVQSKHRFTRPEIAALLRAHKFRISRLTYLNALPFPFAFAKRKIFRNSRDTSDVKSYPPLLDAAFRALTAAEHGWLRIGGTWAWGTSVFAVARKPKGD